ncbi:MAG: hypothetical protein K6C95_01190 [Lachnospiraceae bacterium]|nr:hypothetical protein [Lachnospiraceae bacterium]
MTSVNVYETVRAMAYSMRDIEFGDAVFISHKRPFYLPRGVRFGKIDRLNDIDAFNHACVYKLQDYVKTDYMLLVHADGFVVHPECWEDEFLKYDYIGSPWPVGENDAAYTDASGRLCRVGNSVSVRSKRLLEYPSKHDLPWERDREGFYNEDTFLCVRHRAEMESEGLKWAPFEMALRFGREKPLPENEGLDTFIFHKWWGENEKYPQFRSPYKRFKDCVRPLLFWRRTRSWRDAHGFEDEG